MSPLGKRKGIILAGGKGQRLTPLTSAISKHLLPVYDKPMIYYPLSTLMLSGVKDFLIITTPKNHPTFVDLLEDGTKWGVEFNYEIQKEPNGIAEAFLIANSFIGKSSVALALGDNLFHGNDLISMFKSADSCKKGATIFAYPVVDPERYGVVEFDKNGSAISIEEKPTNPLSQFAITGLYFYDNSVIEKAKKLTFSERGELEITELNQMYLQEGELNVAVMGRGMAWLDTGTFDSLQDASSYIRTLEHRQGLKVGCPEEVAWRKGWITDAQLEAIAISLIHSGYGEYLLRLLNGNK